MIYPQHNKIIISFALLLFFIGTLHSQIKDTNDSIKTWYQQGKLLYKKGDYDSAIAAFKKANSEAIKLNDTIRTINSLSRIGLSYLAKENYIESENYFKKALKIELKNNDSVRIAKGYNNVGIAKFYRSQLDSCLFYYNKALVIYRATSNKDLPQFIKNIGLVYQKKGDYKEASNLLFEAAKMFENLNNEGEVAAIYSILGSIYNEWGYDSLSLQYHKSSLEIRKKFDNQLAIAQSLNNLANITRRVHGADSSLIMYRKALIITKNVNNKKLESAILNNIGEIYLDRGNFDKSKEFFLNSLELKRNLGDQLSIAYTMLNLAKIHLQEKQFQKAEKLILEGLSISKSVNSPSLTLQYYGIYSQFLTLNERFQKATQYYTLYQNLKDSLLNEFKLKALSEAQVKYQTFNLEKEIAFLKPLEKEIELLNLRSESQKDKIKFQRFINWSMGIGILLMLIFVLLIWRIGHQRKKMNNLLELKNEEITHRVKNNLEILTSIFSSQSRMISDKKTKSILIQNQHRIKAINHLYYRLSNEPNDDVSAKIYFESLIDELLFSLNFSKEYCALHIDEIKLNTDTMLHIGLLINELITNALKHGLKDKENPLLEVSLHNNDSLIKLRVKDNGPGLNENMNIDQIKSYGMKLINKLVTRQLEGELIYNYEKGAIFTVKIPQDES